jgi:hypothetical protein
MAGTYDHHADKADRLVTASGFEKAELASVTLQEAQVRATLALAAAVRELVVATSLPPEALDAIRQKITDPAGNARVGYSRRKSGRPPADRPAEDLTTPTQ